MELALSFNAADASRIEKYAARINMSALDYIREAVMKPIDEEDARAKANAEYLAMLDRGFQDLREGKGTRMTWEQLEDLRNG
ncbi:MAG: hypothetical protein IJ812_01175 [Schwartzia sp.]|nr:hypothetical protein [Schwartzia sp. (in: firmicutes)]